MKIMNIAEGETVTISSPNVVEFHKDGEVWGETHKGINEVLYLTGVRGFTYVLTDRLPDEREW